VHITITSSVNFCFSASSTSANRRCSASCNHTTIGVFSKLCVLYFYYHIIIITIIIVIIIIVIIIIIISVFCTVRYTLYESATEYGESTYCLRSIWRHHSDKKYAKLIRSALLQLCLSVRNSYNHLICQPLFLGEFNISQPSLLCELLSHDH
jgi:hypothetical protein